MNSLSLYHLTAQVRDLLDSDDAFDPETGELSPALVDALAMTKEKGANVCAYVLNQEAVIASMDAHIAQVAEKRTKLEKKNIRLREYLAANMKAAGITNITAHDGTFSAVLMIERDASVEIFDEMQIPAEYMKAPKPPAPKASKTDIRKALDAGKDVPGAKIVRNDRLVLG